MDIVWITFAKQDFAGEICGNTYQQNTTCKYVFFVRIILVQEDSMSGGCVFYVRRDVLSEKKLLFSM